jgi:hypothetical protein
VKRGTIYAKSSNARKCFEKPWVSLLKGPSIRTSSYVHFGVQQHNVFLFAFLVFGQYEVGPPVSNCQKTLDRKTMFLGVLVRSIPM